MPVPKATDALVESVTHDFVESLACDRIASTFCPYDGSLLDSFSGTITWPYGDPSWTTAGDLAFSYSIIGFPGEWFSTSSHLAPGLWEIHYSGTARMAGGMSLGTVDASEFAPTFYFYTGDPVDEYNYRAGPLSAGCSYDFWLGLTFYRPNLDGTGDIEVTVTGRRVG